MDSNGSFWVFLGPSSSLWILMGPCRSLFVSSLGPIATVVAMLLICFFCWSNSENLPVSFKLRGQFANVAFRYHNVNSGFGDSI